MMEAFDSREGDLVRISVGGKGAREARAAVPAVVGVGVVMRQENGEKL